MGNSGLFFEDWYFEDTRNVPLQYQVVSTGSRKHAGIHTGQTAGAKCEPGRIAEGMLTCIQSKLLEPGIGQGGRPAEHTLEDLCKEDLGVSALGRIFYRWSKEAGTTFCKTT